MKNLTGDKEILKAQEASFYSFTFLSICSKSQSLLSKLTLFSLCNVNSCSIVLFLMSLMDSIFVQDRKERPSMGSNFTNFRHLKVRHMDLS